MEVWFLLLYNGKKPQQIGNIIPISIIQENGFMLHFLMIFPAPNKISLCQKYSHKFSNGSDQ